MRRFTVLSLLPRGDGEDEDEDEDEEGLMVSVCSTAQWSIDGAVCPFDYATVKEKAGGDRSRSFCHFKVKNSCSILSRSS